MNRETISRRRFLQHSFVGMGIFLLKPHLSDISLAKAESLPANFSINKPGILNGHFYTETRGNFPFPAGFSIYNDKDAPLWQKYQELGGTKVLGYPISNRFQLDGIIYQATQNFLLQNNPDLGGVVLANTLDFLNQKGFDPELYKYGIPHHTTDDGSQGIPEKSKDIHRSWLSDPEITKFYKNNANFESIYGSLLQNLKKEVHL